MDVKVIAARYTDRPKTDAGERVFRIADHIVVGAEKLARGGCMSATSFARWSSPCPRPGSGGPHASGDGSCLVHRIGEAEVTMEDGRRETAKPGVFFVHPRNSVHGLRNNGNENFVYIALSTGA